MNAVRQSVVLTGGIPRPPLSERTHVYIGPDALMPLASALAAVGGFLLMFWRRVVGAFKFIAEKFSPKR